MRVAEESADLALVRKPCASTEIWSPAKDTLAFKGVLVPMLPMLALLLGEPRQELAALERQLGLWNEALANLSSLSTDDPDSIFFKLRKSLQ